MKFLFDGLRWIRTGWFPAVDAVSVLGPLMLATGPDSTTH
jgi:hypothetical protein